MVECLKGNNKKYYSINISFIPFAECNISIRKNSPLNSIDLLNLENFESTTAVLINFLTAFESNFSLISLGVFSSNEHCSSDFFLFFTPDEQY
jgi:S-adenosylhomocysteine hydrolase